MKQFNLEEYLQNPSRKVVTRNGSKVRTICTDKKGDSPIVALITTLDGVAKEEYIIGSANTGELVSSLQNRTSSNKYFNEFVLDNGSFTKTGTVSYVLKAWVTGSEDEIKLVLSDSDGVCSDSTYTTKDTCEANNGVWGSSHKIESSSNMSYQFKVILKGGQV